MAETLELTEEQIISLLGKARVLDTFFDQISLEEEESDYVQYADSLSRAQALSPADAQFVQRVASRVKKTHQVIEALSQRYGVDETGHITRAQELYNELCKEFPAKVELAWPESFNILFRLPAEAFAERRVGHTPRARIPLDQSLNRALKALAKGETTTNLGWIAFMMNSQTKCDEESIWEHERKHVIDRFIRPDETSNYARELSAHLYGLDTSQHAFERSAKLDFRSLTNQAEKNLSGFLSLGGYVPNTLLDPAIELAHSRGKAYDFIRSPQARQVVKMIERRGICPGELSYAVALTDLFEVPQMLVSIHKYVHH